MTEYSRTDKRCNPEKKSMKHSHKREKTITLRCLIVKPDKNSENNHQKKKSM
jgi:hypothetical protein